MAAAVACSLALSEASEANASISVSVPSDCSLAHRAGRFGMIKVPSLVFDIELEDNGIGGQWQEEDLEEDEVVSEIQRFVQPTTGTEARLHSDVKCALQHAKDDTARLVSILTALGYRCCLRTALGGGDGADCLRNLRHTFITCETPLANGAPARQYIVDPLFKEQFIIAKATPRYASILAAIPQVFVGPEEHLELLVTFLSSEVATAFRQLGSVLPPWRHASSMLSKWKPRKSVDESAAARAAAAAAAPAAAAGTGMLAVAPAHLQWPSRPAAAAAEQPRNNAQAAARNWGQPYGFVPAAAMPIGSQRQSFVPQRVVIGGHFPLIPTPAHAS